MLTVSILPREEKSHGGGGILKGIKLGSSSSSGNGGESYMQR